LEQDAMISLVMGAALALAAQADPSAATQAGTTAQGAMAPTVGMKVIGPDGSQVGTVSQVNPNVVVVDTGSAKVGLAPSSLASRDGALVVGSSRADLEAAAAKAAAASAAQTSALMVAGTKVVDPSGAPVGSVVSTDAANVVVATAAHRAALPRTAFAASGGSLVIGMTAAQLDAAAAAAGGK
jgi:hypothetical protein